MNIEDVRKVVSFCFKNQEKWHWEGEELPNGKGEYIWDFYDRYSELTKNSQEVVDKKINNYTNAFMKL